MLSGDLVVLAVVSEWTVFEEDAVGSRRVLLDGFTDHCGWDLLEASRKLYLILLYLKLVVYWLGELLGKGYLGSILPSPCVQYGGDLFIKFSLAHRIPCLLLRPKEILQLASRVELYSTAILIDYEQFRRNEVLWCRQEEVFFNHMEPISKFGLLLSCIVYVERYSDMCFAGLLKVQLKVVALRILSLD